MHDVIKAAHTKKVENGEKGHQTTPSFVREALERAIELLDVGGVQQTNKRTAIASRALHAAGGFTDVGRHTGSEPRNTGWPLVREVLKVWRAGGLC